MIWMRTAPQTYIFVSLVSCNDCMEGQKVWPSWNYGAYLMKNETWGTVGWDVSMGVWTYILEEVGHWGRLLEELFHWGWVLRFKIPVIGPETNSVSSSVCLHLHLFLSDSVFVCLCLSVSRYFILFCFCRPFSLCLSLSLYLSQSAWLLHVSLCFSWKSPKNYLVSFSVPSS